MKLNNLHSCNCLAGAAFLALAATLPAGADNYQSAVVSQSPVGYWRLDDTVQPPVLPIYAADLGKLGAAGEGTNVLDAIRGQPGALFESSATSYRFSNPGWVVTYLGSHVDVAGNTSLNPNGPFSVELWAKPSSQAPDLFSPVCSLDASENSNNSREGYIIYYDGSSTNWNFRIGGTNGYVGNVSGGTATPGVWQHIVATYSGSSVALYVNGAQVASGALTGAFVPNSTQPFRIGATTIPNRTFDGWIEEVAFYSLALDGDTIKEHYDVGSTNGTAYPAQVLSGGPVGYWRLGEPGDPAAPNLGTLGAAANGSYVYDAIPGQPGPATPAFAGFVTANKAVSFNGVSGYVSVPALNLDTNTVTITAWVMPNGSQNSRAGLVVSDAGTTAAGLTMDVVAGLGLSYNWNNDEAAYEWDSFLTLSDSVWNFVALVVQPTEADLYVVDSTNASDFTGATNYITHAVQDFEGVTLIGDDSGQTNFDGSICQVAIFNRSLGAGDVYSEYAAAVGNLKPQVFVSPAAPANTIFAGDAVTLSVDAGGTPPLSYQWYFGAAAIQGATNSTLTKVWAVSDTGSYSVKVANSYGTATSGAAAISVAAVSAPTVLQGPVSRTLYPGATLTMSVTASGGALYYQWQRSSTNISGATNSSFQVTNITAADAGTYSGIVSNRIGTASFGPVTITIPTPSAGSYEAVVTADKPEAWWRLDEAPGSTNLWDSMGRHDGYYTNVSGNPLTLGVPGALVNDPDTAVSFDGTSASYGVAPYSAALNTETFTLELWANSTSVNNFGSPVSEQFGLKGFFFAPSGPDTNFPSGWALLVDSGGQTFGVPSSASPKAISLGWTHLAVTYGGTDGMRFFINGQWDGIDYDDFDRNNAGPLIIGALGESSTAAPDEFFEGQVDEVALYTTELSPTRVQAHYQGRYGVNNKPIFLSSLVSQVVAAGTPVSFSATVAGSLPIGLQWEKNGAPIAGATTNTLTLTNTVLSDTATYQLVAANSAGSTNLSASLVVLPPPTFANVTNNLLLHLRFDGNYNDASGRGNNGTPMGTPTFVSGKIGSQALHYSTMTDTGESLGTVTNANYVSLGTPADLNLGTNWANGVSFSVAFWIRLPAGYVGGDLPFFGSATGSDNAQGFTFSPSYKLGGWEWCLDDGASSGDFDINGSNNSINDGNWHHLAVTFDSAAALGTTYLDGVQVQSDSLAGLGDFDSGNSISVGQDPTGLYPEPSSGDIDDLGVWQTVLTPLDVCTIYGAGANAGVSFDTVGQPKLGFLRSGNDLVFIWQSGTLLQASSLDGPWSPVSGATAPTATVTPGSGNNFYRVRM
jgi:hypothetical protein